MKVIDANYNVRMGYWALRNNMKEYKAYATVIWMFDPNFVNLWQVPGDNSWLAKKKLKLEDPFIMPSRIFDRDEQNGPIFISRSHMQEVAREWKWSKWRRIWIANFKL
jgi:hypothetical protein